MSNCEKNVDKVINYNDTRKYKFTDEVKIIDDIHGKYHTLHRIEALIDIPRHNVKAGDLGGFIEYNYNLSHHDYAWVADNAIVFGQNAIVKNDAIVRDNAIVTDNAVISGEADVNDRAMIYGNAQIFERAYIGNCAKVYDDAKVFGDAEVSYSANVHGRAEVSGSSKIVNDTDVSGNVYIKGKVLVDNRAIVRGNGNICKNAIITDDTILDGFYCIGKDAYITNSNDVMTFTSITPHGKSITFYTCSARRIRVCIENLHLFIPDLKKFCRRYYGNSKYSKLIIQAYRMARRKFNIGIKLFERHYY